MSNLLPKAFSENKEKDRWFSQSVLRAKTGSVGIYAS